MAKLVLLLYFSKWLMLASCTDIINDTELLTNSSDPNKDMYVIHAMVYQVGIVTNKTDNDTANFNTTGHQEALTLYHNNGSQVDLSQIPEPLLTNVQAQSLVGVAPVSSPQTNIPGQLPWGSLKNLANTVALPNAVQGSESSIPAKSSRTESNLNISERKERSFENLYRRLLKRAASSDVSPVAISNGAAVIPQAAGVRSIAIPPLLTLNNNLSEIPVPIPNTSIVHYAKINTLITKP